MTLAQFQHKFANLMFDAPEALERPPAALADMLATGDIALPERLAVYRHNVVGNLTNALMERRPLLKALVGEDFLKKMTQHYVVGHKPSGGNLNLYGQDYATFIRAFKPAESLPYLADIAALETAMNNAYYAADDAPLTAEGLAHISLEALGDLHLKQRDSVSIVQSGYPLLDIRDLCLNPDQDTQLDLDKGGTILLIHRPQLEVTIATLQADEAAMLKACQNHPIGKALEHTLESYTDFNVQAFLQKHIALETFAALEPNEEER